MGDESDRPRGERLDSREVFRGRTVRLDGRTGVVFVEDSPAAAHLKVDISPSLLPVLMPLLARLRQFFDLDAQPAVVDAHLDAIYGEGMLDNASGSATILDVAQMMRNVHPQNRLRFIWFGGEELGLLGSIAYVNHLTAAQLGIKTLHAQLESARAQLQQAQAQLDQANLNLQYTRVTAAQSGRVVKLSGAVGTLATAGQSLMMFVPDDVWVVANYKETQLRHMRPGQPVEFTIDAYPGRKLTGHVASVQPG